MGTTCGFALFLDPKVNAMFKKVLNVWGDFLKSPPSAEVLGTDSNGWFCVIGLNDLTTEKHHVLLHHICDCRGFSSLLREMRKWWHFCGTPQHFTPVLASSLCHSQPTTGLQEPFELCFF